MPPAGNRGFAAGKYALEIGGASSGSIQSFSGGDVYADVVELREGGEAFVRKQLGAVHYDDIVVSCAPTGNAPLLEWLAETLQARPSRKDGAVATFDLDGKPASRLEFSQALVSSIGFPALDASSKEAARLTVSLAPERTRLKPGGAGPAPKPAGAQKKALASGFRLAIDGLDCKGVGRVAPLVVHQKLVEHTVGTARDVQKQPAQLEIPDLVVTLPETKAATWRAWHESFVVQGRNGQAEEKSGTLELLAPDLKTVHLTLRFQGLGIYRLTSEKVEAGSENVRRLTASMYCETVELFVGAAPEQPAPPAPPKPARPVVAPTRADTIRIVR